MSNPAPDPKRQVASQKALRARWGEQRVARLDELTPHGRRLVLALIAADKAAQAAGEAETAA